MSIADAIRSRYARPALHLLCLLPMAAMIAAAIGDDLGANPVERLTHETGEWTLRLLLVTLAVTPLRRWTGLGTLPRFRRMLGLYSFFYLCCHFLIWFVADHSGDIASMIEDIVKRPYITLGFSALVLMIPLAVTSNQASIRRLGRRWKALHQLVYAIVLLGVLHFIWLVKADYLEAGIYAAIAIFLLLQRVGPFSRLGLRSA